MATFLFQVHTGPNDPNKVTLGFLVAATAVTEGHEVTVFLAGDGVHLFAPDILKDVEGEGTGRLSDHIETIERAGGRFMLSAMSAEGRGYDEGLLDGHPAEFARPPQLVALAAAADTVLCY